MVVGVLVLLVGVEPGGGEPRAARAPGVELLGPPWCLSAVACGRRPLLLVVLPWLHWGDGPLGLIGSRVAPGSGAAGFALEQALDDDDDNSDDDDDDDDNDNGDGDGDNEDDDDDERR